MSYKSIENKVIIVTGGSGGIGSAIVNKLSDNGAKVVSVFCNNCPYEQSSANVVGFRADLRRSEEWDRLITFAQKKFYKIDILINSAGYLEPGDFLSLEENEIKKIIEINFTLVTIGIHKVLEIFRKQKEGHIINIGSLGGIVPMPFSSVYCATKFAVRGFTFSLAEEFKGTEINISLITPGSVITKMLDHEARNENTAISFVSKPVNPIKVARSVLKIIRKPKIELIIPGSQSVGSKLISFSPSVFSKLYWLLHKIGLTRKRSYLNRYCNFNLMGGTIK
jgi:short-subunit dehydrogenase